MNLPVNVARFLLPILVVVYWIVGFYPFHWLSPFGAYDNRVKKTAAGGLFFPEQGIAFTKTPPKWVGTAMQDNTFEVALEIRASTQQIGPARILTLSHDNHLRNFTVGQSDHDLVLRLRTRATSLNGIPDYTVRGVFGDTAFHHVLISVRPEEVRIRVDGRRRFSASLPPDALSTWNPKYRLALGNEFTFQRPWRGEVRMAVVRVRDEKYAYTAADLQIPRKYERGSKVFIRKIHHLISLPSKAPDLIDWIINLVGFVPFGFLLALVSRRPISLPAGFAFCAALSLSIEIGQLFFELGHPQASDVILNTLGGGIGAWTGRPGRWKACFADQN